MHRPSGIKTRHLEALCRELGFEEEWVRQRASMFQSGLQTEALRRRRLFEQSADELLTAHVPIEPFAFEFPRRTQPVCLFLPGMTDTRGELVPPSGEPPADGKVPGVFRLPAWQIPWLEGWHDMMRYSKQSSELTLAPSLSPEEAEREQQENERKLQEFAAHAKRHNWPLV